uniref:Uncharacterized protein n=1 Tax=Thermosporothrix sp. COM3 TaxID=2490863 RepID=A0A455SZY7_9CHLR|nr:hypothetical protein KTC_64560 [Thermosporothrix sp. COM3]
MMSIPYCYSRSLWYPCDERKFLIICNANNIAFIDSKRNQRQSNAKKELKLSIKRTEKMMIRQIEIKTYLYKD